MADAQRDLQIVFTSDTTQAEEGMSQFSNSINGLQNAIAGLGLGLVAQRIADLGVQSVKAASDFQSSMALIQTQALASKSEVDHMTQALLDMSSKVGTTPEKLAEGLYHIESAGFRGAKALDMLKAAAEGAAIGHANLEDVTQALISEIASGIKGVDNMSQAMGVLNAIVGSGDMRMEQLALAMGTGILPSAQSFGLSIQDVGAALATLTDNAVPADEAATRLRMTFALLAAPTKQATKEFESIGLSQLQLADDMRSGGLVKALQDLHDHLYAIQPATEVVVKGTKMSEAQLQSYKDKIANTQTQLKILGEEHIKSGVATDKHNLAITKAQEQLAQYQAKVAGANQTIQTFAGGQLSASERADLLSRAFGGGRSSSAILTLLDQLDRVKDKYGEISKATGKLGDSWEVTQQTASFQMQQFQANLQKLEIEFGTVFLPVLIKVLDFMNKHKETFAILAGVIAGVFTVAVIGATVATIAFLAPLLTATIAIGALTAPLWAVGLAIGIFVAAVISGALLISMHFKEIQKTFEDLYINGSKFIKNLEKDIATSFSNIGKSIGQSLDNAKKTIDSKLSEAKSSWENYNNYLTTLHAKQKAEVDKFWKHDLPFAIGFGLGWLSVEIPKTFNNIVKWFEDLPKNTEKSMKQLHDSTIQWWSRTQTDAALSLYKMSTDASNNFQQIMGNLNTWMQQTWKNVTTWWSKTQTDAALWLYQMTTDASNFIGQIPSIVDKFLKQLDKTVDNDLNIVWNTATKWWSQIENIFNNIIKAAENVIHTVEQGFSAGQKAANVPHRAMGGYASGLTLVGENGPELVNLPSGSYVHSNSDSQKMMGGINITIQYPQLTSQQNVNQLIQDIKRALGREAELAKLGAL